MPLFEEIKKDMITAVKAGHNQKSQILKMLIASIKNAQIASEEELKDLDIEKMLRKEARKIEDSIEQFQKAGRKDLVEKEEQDLAVVKEYLPDLMDEEDISKVVDVKIKELGVDSMKDIGKVMGVVMKELDGKADGNTVKNIVHSRLTS